MRRGRETVVIDMSDDGLGMNRRSIEAFFNLSDSVKPANPPAGKPARRMIGYKGHGTKIYYNSDQLEILSYDGIAPPIFCCVTDLRGQLAERKVPLVQIEELDDKEFQTRRAEWGLQDLADSSGTSIRVIGYHGNSKNGLEHDRLRDFIRWLHDGEAGSRSYALSQTPVVPKCMISSTAACSCGALGRSQTRRITRS